MILGMPKLLVSMLVSALLKFWISFQYSWNFLFSSVISTVQCGLWLCHIISQLGSHVKFLYMVSHGGRLKKICLPQAQILIPGPSCPFLLSSVVVSTWSEVCLLPPFRHFIPYWLILDLFSFVSVYYITIVVVSTQSEISSHLSRLSGPIRLHKYWLKVSWVVRMLHT